MKKYLLKILFVLVIFSCSSFASDLSELMNKANNYYKNNQYQLAIEEYNKIVRQGYEGASLFYNLGNAHYRLGQIGYAILYYEKALKYAPSDDDIKHNLALARLNLKDKVDSLPPFFIFNLWEGLIALFSVTGWTYVTYIFYILLLIAIIFYFFSKNSTQQRISFFSGIGFLVLMLFSILLLNVKMNKEYNIKSGVVIRKEITAKSSPDNSSKDSFTIHEGLKVKLEDRVDNWIKIRLDDGKVGWVLDNDLGEI